MNQSQTEKVMSNVLNQRSMLLDVLTAYIPYLIQARKLYAEYRMNFFDDDPADYDEPEVSDEEYVLDSVIDVLRKARDMNWYGEKLMVPYRIGTKGYEGMMRKILEDGKSNER